MAEVDVATLKKMKVTDLREECEKRGIDSKGNKGVLLERLCETMKLDSGLMDSSALSQEPASQPMDECEANPAAATDDCHLEVDDDSCYHVDVSGSTETTTKMDEEVETTTKDESQADSSVDSSSRSSKRKYRSDAREEVDVDSEEFKKSLEEFEEPSCELEEDELPLCLTDRVDNSRIMLDDVICDLHCVLSEDGLSLSNRKANGFNMIWAAAKACASLISGKSFYEVKITQIHKVELAISEKPCCAVRVGWSGSDCDLQLGSEDSSFGFETSGRVFHDNRMTCFTCPSFDVGDVIGVHCDLESEEKAIRFTKNGEEITNALRKIPDSILQKEGFCLFPHVMVKNIDIECNFGDKPQSYEPLEGHQFVSLNSTLSFTPLPTRDMSQLEVLVLSGMPAAGKTYWAEQHKKSHPEKRFTILNTLLLRERFKLTCEARSRGPVGYTAFQAKLRQMFLKTLELASKHPRNYIIDSNNTFRSTRRKMATLFGNYQCRCVSVLVTNETLRTQSSHRSRGGHDYSFAEISNFKLYCTIPTKDEGFCEVEHVGIPLEEAQTEMAALRKEVLRAKERRSVYQHSSDRRYGGSSSSYGGGYRRDQGYQSSSRYGGSSSGGYSRRYDNRSSSSYGGRSRDGGYSSGGRRYDSYPQRSWDQNRRYGGRSNGGDGYNDYGRGSSSSYGGGSGYYQGQSSGYPYHGGDSGYGGGYSSYGGGGASSQSGYYSGGYRSGGSSYGGGSGGTYPQYQGSSSGSGEQSRGNYYAGGYQSRAPPRSGDRRSSQPYNSAQRGGSSKRW